MRYRHIIFYITSIFLIGCTEENSNDLEEFSPKIQGISIAVKNECKMLQFYSSVFKVSFKEVPTHGDTLYVGFLGETAITLAPISITNVDAKDNQIQIDVVVSNVDQTLKSSSENYGKTLGQPALGNGYRVASINDPDGNSIVIRQSINHPGLNKKGLFGFQVANSLAL